MVSHRFELNNLLLARSKMLSDLRLTPILNRNGHGCMLQYALLHLFGYKVTLDDLKAFRVKSPLPIVRLVELT